MKTILAPIDFSEVTQWVMTEAAELARKMGGRLVLLNVTDSRSINEDQISFRNLIREFDEHPLKPTRADELAGGNDPSDDDPVSGDSLQLIGEPVVIILEQAEKVNADYIVMGSHGRSRLYDLVFGSVAEGVLRDAPCPVMLVPSRRKMKIKCSTPRKLRKPARRSPTKVRKKSDVTASPKGEGSRARNVRAR